jgi:hypothetical protein
MRVITGIRVAMRDGVGHAPPRRVVQPDTLLTE